MAICKSIMVTMLLPWCCGAVGGGGIPGSTLGFHGPPFQIHWAAWMMSAVVYVWFTGHPLNRLSRLSGLLVLVVSNRPTQWQ